MVRMIFYRVFINGFNILSDVWAENWIKCENNYVYKGKKKEED